MYKSPSMCSASVSAPVFITQVNLDQLHRPRFTNQCIGLIDTIGPVVPCNQHLRQP